MPAGDEPNACLYPAAPPPVAVPLITTQPHPCPYLPGRTAVTRAFWAPRVDGEIYHNFMDASFRRSGNVIYQPVCPGCRQCVPLRVLVDRFKPDKSQRRCSKRNQDLQIDLSEPVCTDEKYELYARYIHGWHARGEEPDRKSFEEFLYRSPVRTLEFTYRDRDNRLLAVGICDICSRSLSSVYFYFDPDQSRRGLGTFGILKEIEHAAALGIAHYYLGYWIADAASMSYKALFRPHERLGPDQVWRGD